MKSTIVRIKEYKNNANGAEKKIVDFLLENPEQVVNYTIHELAEKTYSSASTIVRLCKKLGFEGYKDFQKSLVYELALRKEALDEKTQEITREDSLESIIEKVTYKNVVSLENTMKLIDLEILERCVDLLDKANTINFFGMGSSLLVAKDAYLKFLRVNKPCLISDDWHAQLLQARNITKDDVAIAISYSGMTEEVLRCVQTVKENNAPVIAITRFEENPLSTIADYNLYVSATEFIFRSGAMSSRISQLSIIDILFTAFINRNYDKYLKQFKKTHIQKPYKSID
ncbi:MAG TPA: MurR/RpiR family transcriptional regulator [Soehngenia sp.]|nr:MurR/RpiR family transcriptional regulator [Soehngenia sp.]